MKDVKFERVFATVAHYLGENPVIVVSKEKLQERIEELQSCMQGIATGNQSFVYAFNKTCQDQVRRIGLPRFSQLQAIVDKQIEEGVDNTTAWLSTYAEYYPYKATVFTLKCEQDDDCDELKEFFDFTCHENVAEIAKRLYC